MSEKMVFLALQDNEDARPIRESVEARIGRGWNPQDIHLTLVSLSGNIDETDDYFALERT